MKMHRFSIHRVIRPICLFLVAGILFTTVDITAFAKEDKWSKAEITIKTEEDWNTLAEKCQDDSYSVGKTIRLASDLTLSTEAKMIPYFAGTFAGDGYTIQGLDMQMAQSMLGLFSQTAEQAVIQDLNVKVMIEPEGDQSKTGGIVADNYGTIIGCSFEGVVSGTDDTGAIAGVNEATGQIIDSRSVGMVVGVHYTGGIAGRNLGTIYGCTNTSSVNTTVYEASGDFASLEETIYRAWKEYSLEESLPSSSDTGGITGYSSGIVSSCVNEGTIGYAHIGYNVGGIIGRQCGYVGQCANRGTVNGRKDVGGIVGQAVPDVTISYGEDTIAKLKSALEELETLLKKTTSDADDASKTVSKRLDMVSAYADVASDSADKIYNQVNDNVDTNLDTLDDTSAKSKSYLRRFQSVSKKVVAASKLMDEAQTLLNDWYDDYSERYGTNTSVNSLNDAIDNTQAAAEPLAEGAMPRDGELDELNEALDELQHYMDIVEEALQDDRLSEAMDKLSDASNQMSDAVEEADGILEDLSNEEEVTIVRLGDSFDQETDRLHGALTGISDQLSLLNTEMSNESDILIADINDVSDQFVLLMNLFIDALNEVQTFDTDDIYEDVSEETINNTTQGKVIDCQNYSLIEGDVNTGGIIGAMAIEYAEDPEDDLNESETNNYKNTYQTKAVIQNCSNYGEVNGKKNCVGGVVGRMDLGIIVNCYSAGIIHSTTGDYVGGICGYALSNIRDCVSKAILAGRDYVAGIAGVCDKLTGSYSMAQLVSYERFAGAIAGDYKDLDQVENNYFVSTGTAGINRVNYEGRAQRLTYEEVMAREDAPEEFASFVVSFRMDERLEDNVGEEPANKEQTVVGMKECSYGEQVSAEDYPSVEEQDGYYVVWDQPCVEQVTGDCVVSGRYVAYADLVQSDALSDDGRPIIVVEGQFRENDRLQVQDISATLDAKQVARAGGDWIRAMKKQEVIGAWQVTIPEDGQSEHTMRYRVGKDSKRCRVYIKTGDDWEKVSYETSGQHLVFPVSGTSCEILVVK